jgi:putative serine protease PepD
VEPKKRRALPVAALVLAGALGGGAVGGLVGAHYGDDKTISLGSSAPAVAAPAADPKSYTAIANKVLPSVVSISVRAGNSGDTGSGFVIRKDGYVLTNNHVIAAAVDGGTITVTFNDGSTASGTVVGADAASDLAVVKVNRNDLKPVSLGSSASLKVGDPVLAIGSPLGLSGTVTQGIVSALNRPVNTTQDQQQLNPFGSNAVPLTTVINAIQTDAAINPGNSGGPLVDGAGQVIGITSAIASLGSSFGGQSGNIGVGFAIPMDQARVIADELIATGHATHPVLGVQVAAVTTSSGAQQVMVRSVQSGGPAAKAGMRVGDVIVALDGKAVSSGDALIATVRSHNPGEKVSVTFLRDGKRQTVSVTLADAPTSQG